MRPSELPDPNRPAPRLATELDKKGSASAGAAAAHARYDRGIAPVVPLPNVYVGSNHGSGRSIPGRMTLIYADVDPNVESFYATLWLGALMLAGNSSFDPFPDELDDLATRFFTLYRPAAKA